MGAESGEVTKVYHKVGCKVDVENGEGIAISGGEVFRAFVFAENEEKAREKAEEMRIEAKRSGMFTKAREQFKNRKKFTAMDYEKILSESIFEKHGNILLARWAKK
jgi:hypothetical protein